MSDSKNRAGSSKRRHARVIKVAPVTRAIRSALAISATTLALTASGGVLAGTLAIPATTAIHHDFARRDANQPVIDLTLVHDDFAPSSVHAHGGSDVAMQLAAVSGIAQDVNQALAVASPQGDVADLTTVLATPGPGGVSGSDDNVLYSVDNPAAYGVSYSTSGIYSANSNYGIADDVFIHVGSLANLVNYGTLDATGYTWAAGLEVEAVDYAHDVRNAAGSVIYASTSGASGQAWGIYAVSGNDTTVYNDGGIYASASGAYGTATGLYAAATAGDAYAGNTGVVSAYTSGNFAAATGMEAVAYNAASVNNSGSIDVYATGYYGRGTGMLAYSTAGDSTLVNTGAITVSTYAGNAVGMYGYAAAGTVNATNASGISVSSAYGLADGIFASGLEVEATNTGAINATGYTWAAGIEAQGSDGTTVANAGAIYARATGYYGQAFGIYATGGTGGVSVTNTGGITAVGSYATGIQVTSDGDVAITNNGGIGAGNGSSYLATGIYATTNYDGADITVVNNGGVAAYSIYGSAGISVAALGAGSSASVTNTGGVVAVAYSGYGYGATGVLVSADADASIDNQGGITAYTNGLAYGAMALAFNGDASVTNSGGITASGYEAFGAVASSSYGTASIDNSGMVRVSGSYIAQGLAASGVAGASITNSGYVGSQAYIAYGAFAQSGNGVASITNTADGLIEVYGFIGVGAIGISSYGDVAIDNAGAIRAYGYAFGIGAFERSDYGNVSAINSGTIYAVSEAGMGVGIYAGAVAGDAYIGNSGLVVGISDYGTATGVRATGATVEVVNSGEMVGASTHGGRAAGIDVYGSTSVTVDNEGLAGGVAKYSAGASAYGIYALSGGDVSITNGYGAGAIAMARSGYATGVLAYSFGGNVTVDNAGQIYAQGAYSATGVFAGASDAGNASLTSSGEIVAESILGSAIGAAGSAYDGNVDLASSGTVTATSKYGNAIGMTGYSLAGIVTLTNSGDITAYSHDGTAIGLSSITGSGDATAYNSGTIQAGSYNANALGIVGYSASGSVVVGNSGSIETYSYAGSSIGIYGYAAAGDVNIDNAAGGSISAYSYYGLADGIFASGATVEVTNGGSIYANGYQWAAGIEAQGSDSASVGNTGDISVVSYYGGHGYGVFATGGAGGASVTNDGTIEVLGSYATGIYAGLYAGTTGTVTIANTGSITAGSAQYIQDTYLATGIRALTNYAGSNILVSNSGDITANAYYGASGIDVAALGEGSSASVDSSGTIYAQQGNKYGYGAMGIIASATVDATVSNSGSITTVSAGGSYGAMALAFSGTSNVTNSGDISATSTALLYYSAVGMLSSSANGAAYANNSGTISAISNKYVGTGIQVNGNTFAGVTNSGAISVEAKYAYGVLATAGQGDVAIDNLAGGDVSVLSMYNFAAGLVGISTAGDVMIDNAGTVEALALDSAFGALGIADAGNATVANSGSAFAYSYAGTATAAGAQSYSGIAEVYNSGSLQAYSHGGDAIGAMAQAVTGVAVVDNSGTIDANTQYVGGVATGVAVQSYGSAFVYNSGLVTAESVDGASAIGVDAQAYGNVLVSNSGQVNATDSDYAVAIRADSVAGIATVVNTGVLRTFSALEGQVAISGGDGVQQIANYGDIYGAIITAGGDDLMFNGNAGIWHVTNHSTDFGTGEDAITNGTGGKIVVSGGGAIHTGADDDSVINASGGTIVLANGSINLDASGSAGNTFVNDGRILVKGTGLIDMGYAVALVAGANALPLTNNGVLDMVDGFTDDALTINGDLGGSGSVAIDLDQLTLSADQLYVNGSMVGSQSVDVSLGGAALTAHVDPIQFAHVTGDATADSFVGGHVVGYDESSFLDLKVNVISQIDASNATADIFSVGLDVNGLNDAGSLGASVASVAHGVMASQIGTWRQRVGMIPAKRDDQVGLSPWVRVFGDSGSVKLAHHEDNFGGSGSFGFDQSNNGREFGMNVNIRSDLNVGLLAAKTTGVQHLTGSGVGSDHLDSTGFGMYATWIAPNFYVDASYRWLEFDAHFRSAGGLQGTSGNGGAFNVEAGYTAWNVAGIAITPEVQYTRSRVGDFSAIRGSSVDFVANGGASTRGRLGVEFSKTIEGAGWVWTPYGSVNAIREFDGESNYTIGNTFTGSTSTKGTSAMLELGLGAQKDGFSVTGGANWTDGGAFQGVLGGQVVVRYSW